MEAKSQPRQGYHTVALSSLGGSGIVAYGRQCTLDDNIEQKSSLGQA